MENKNITQKLFALFGSLKFWAVTFVQVGALLQAKLNGTLDIYLFISIVQTWCMGVGLVGLVDGVAERLAGKKNK